MNQTYPDCSAPRRGTLSNRAVRLAVLVGALGGLAAVGCGRAATVDPNAAPRAAAVAYVKADAFHDEGRVWDLSAPSRQVGSKAWWIATVNHVRNPLSIAPRGTTFAAIYVHDEGEVKHVGVRTTFPDSRSIPADDIVVRQCNNQWLVVDETLLDKSGKPVPNPGPDGKPSKPDYACYRH